ncbi:MAG: GntR family transcriptional regulator [Gordonia sp. (in: high G+C Gram-positive bacteria)]
MTGLHVEVRIDDPTPPFEQIRRQIAGLIASGALRAGDPLPPHRQLARDLDVAVGTVGRAYRDLEAAGWIESRRGRGTRVRTPPTPTEPASPDALNRLAREFLASARELGFSVDDAASAVRRAADAG